jgi:predicted homoserine dehydrogenase-like protein
VARAVLFNDATLAPLGKPIVDVVATAKTDLKSGQVLDGIGKYTLYGLCENSDTTYREKLLPIGIADGCILKHDVPKDRVLTYNDIILPEGRLVDKLRQEQTDYFKMTEDQLETVS